MSVQSQHQQSYDRGGVCDKGSIRDNSWTRPSALIHCFVNSAYAVLNPCLSRLLASPPPGRDTVAASRYLSSDMAVGVVAKSPSAAAGAAVRFG